MLASLLRRQILVLTLIALAVIGVGITLYASDWGPWAFSDGVGYLVTARNLVEGKGLGTYRPSGTFIPTVTHPPLFPLILALLTTGTGDVLQAARLVNALLIFVMLVSIPLLFRSILGVSSLAAVLAVGLVTHPAMILMFVSAMSEPLFVVTGTSSLLLVCLYLLAPRRSTLYLACGLAAAAMLTRYVGLAYVATGALALLVFDRAEAKKQRLLRTTAYSIAAILPTLAFLAYWALSPHARVVRGFTTSKSFFDSLPTFIGRVGQVLWSWKPIPTPAVLREIGTSPGERIVFGLVLLALVLASAAIGQWIRRESTPAPSENRELQASDPWLLAKVFGLFIAIFLGGMFLAFAFSAPTPDIDFRTLFPVLPALLLAGLSILGALLVVRFHSRVVRWAAIGAMLALPIGSAPPTLDIATGIHRTGLGFTSRGWHESETMQYVEKLDPQAIFVSNAPEAIMLFTGRSAYAVSSPQIPDSDGLVAESPAILSEVDRQICRDDGILILFDESLDGVDAQVGPVVVLGSLSCEPATVFRSPDGAVYSQRVAPD